MKFATAVFIAVLALACCASISAALPTPEVVGCYSFGKKLSGNEYIPYTISSDNSLLFAPTKLEYNGTNVIIKIQSFKLVDLVVTEMVDEYDYAVENVVDNEIAVFVQTFEETYTSQLVVTLNLFHLTPPADFSASVETLFFEFDETGQLTFRGERTAPEDWMIAGGVVGHAQDSLLVVGAHNVSSLAFQEWHHPANEPSQWESGASFTLKTNHSLTFSRFMAPLSSNQYIIAFSDALNNKETLAIVTFDFEAQTAVVSSNVLHIPTERKTSVDIAGIVGNVIYVYSNESIWAVHYTADTWILDVIDEISFGEYGHVNDEVLRSAFASVDALSSSILVLQKLDGRAVAFSIDISDDSGLFGESSEIIDVGDGFHFIYNSLDRSFVVAQVEDVVDGVDVTQFCTIKTGSAAASSSPLPAPSSSPEASSTPVAPSPVPANKTVGCTDVPSSLLMTAISADNRFVFAVDEIDTTNLQGDHAVLTLRTFALDGDYTVGEQLSVSNVSFSISAGQYAYAFPETFSADVTDQVFVTIEKYSDQSSSSQYAVFTVDGSGETSFIQLLSMPQEWVAGGGVLSDSFTRDLLYVGGVTTTNYVARELTFSDGLWHFGGDIALPAGMQAIDWHFLSTEKIIFLYTNATGGEAKIQIAVTAINRDTSAVEVLYPPVQLISSSKEYIGGIAGVHGNVLYAFTDLYGFAFGIIDNETRLVQTYADYITNVSTSDLRMVSETWVLSPTGEFLVGVGGTTVQGVPRTLVSYSEAFLGRFAYSVPYDVFAIGGYPKSVVPKLDKSRVSALVYNDAEQTRLQLCVVNTNVSNVPHVSPEPSTTPQPSPTQSTQPSPSGAPTPLPVPDWHEHGCHTMESRSSVFAVSNDDRFAFTVTEPVEIVNQTVDGVVSYYANLEINTWDLTAEHVFQHRVHSRSFMIEVPEWSHNDVAIAIPLTFHGSVTPQLMVIIDFFGQTMGSSVCSFSIAQNGELTEVDTLEPVPGLLDGTFLDDGQSPNRLYAAVFNMTARASSIVPYNFNGTQWNADEVKNFPNGTIAIGVMLLSPSSGVALYQRGMNSSTLYVSVFSMIGNTIDFISNELTVKSGHGRFSASQSRFIGRDGNVFYIATTGELAGFVLTDEANHLLKVASMQYDLPEFDQFVFSAAFLNMEKNRILVLGPRAFYDENAPESFEGVGFYIDVSEGQLNDMEPMFHVGGYPIFATTDIARLEAFSVNMDENAEGMNVTRVCSIPIARMPSPSVTPAAAPSLSASPSGNPTPSAAPTPLPVPDWHETGCHTMESRSSIFAVSNDDRFAFTVTEPVEIVNVTADGVVTYYAKLEINTWDLDAQHVFEHRLHSHTFMITVPEWSHNDVAFAVPLTFSGSVTSQLMVIVDFFGPTMGSSVSSFSIGQNGELTEVDTLEPVPGLLDGTFVDDGQSPNRLYAATVNITGRVSSIIPYIFDGAEWSAESVKDFPNGTMAVSVMMLNSTSGVALYQREMGSSTLYVSVFTMSGNSIEFFSNELSMKAGNGQFASSRARFVGRDGNVFYIATAGELTGFQLSVDWSHVLKVDFMYYETPDIEGFYFAGSFLNMEKNRILVLGPRALYDWQAPESHEGVGLYVDVSAGQFLNTGSLFHVGGYPIFGTTDVARLEAFTVNMDENAEGMNVTRVCSIPIAAMPSPSVTPAVSVSPAASSSAEPIPSSAPTPLPVPDWHEHGCHTMDSHSSIFAVSNDDKYAFTVTEPVEVVNTTVDGVEKFYANLELSTWDLTEERVFEHRLHSRTFMVEIPEWAKDDVAFGIPLTFSGAVTSQLIVVVDFFGPSMGSSVCSFSVEQDGQLTEVDTLEPVPGLLDGTFVDDGQSPNRLYAATVNITGRVSTIVPYSFDGTQWNADPAKGFPNGTMAVSVMLLNSTTGVALYQRGMDSSTFYVSVFNMAGSNVEFVSNELSVQSGNGRFSASQSRFIGRDENVFYVVTTGELAGFALAADASQLMKIDWIQYDLPEVDQYVFTSAFLNMDKDRILVLGPRSFYDSNAPGSFEGIGFYVNASNGQLGTMEHMFHVGGYPIFATTDVARLEAFAVNLDETAEGTNVTRVCSIPIGGMPSPSATPVAPSVTPTASESGVPVPSSAPTPLPIPDWHEHGCHTMETQSSIFAVSNDDRFAFTVKEPVEVVDQQVEGTTTYYANVELHTWDLSSARVFDHRLHSRTFMLELPEWAEGETVIAVPITFYAATDQLVVVLDILGQNLGSLMASFSVESNGQLTLLSSFTSDVGVLYGTFLSDGLTADRLYGINLEVSEHLSSLVPYNWDGSNWAPEDALSFPDGLQVVQAVMLNSTAGVIMYQKSDNESAVFVSVFAMASGSVSLVSNEVSLSVSSGPFSMAQFKLLYYMSDFVFYAQTSGEFSVFVMQDGGNRILKSDSKTFNAITADNYIYSGAFLPEMRNHILFVGPREMFDDNAPGSTEGVGVYMDILEGSFGPMSELFHIGGYPIFATTDVSFEEVFAVNLDSQNTENARVCSIPLVKLPSPSSAPMQSPSPIPIEASSTPTTTAAPSSSKAASASRSATSSATSSKSAVPTRSVTPSPSELPVVYAAVRAVVEMTAADLSGSLDQIVQAFKEAFIQAVSTHGFSLQLARAVTIRIVREFSVDQPEDATTAAVVPFTEFEVVYPLQLEQVRSQADLDNEEDAVKNDVRTVLASNDFTSKLVEQDADLGSAEVNPDSLEVSLHQNGKKKMGLGAILGAVIGGVVVVGLVALFGMHYKSKLRTRRADGEHARLEDDMDDAFTVDAGREVGEIGQEEFDDEPHTIRLDEIQPSEEEPAEAH